MPRVKRRRGRVAGQGQVAPLGSMLSELNELHARLQRQRSSLDDQIAAVGNAIRALSGSRPASRSPAAMPASARPAGQPSGYRRGSIKEHILRFLASAGGPMGVQEVTRGVLRSGYKSRNKTLAKSVGIALGGMKEVRRVGRGRYQLR